MVLAGDDAQAHPTIGCRPLITQVDWLVSLHHRIGGLAVLEPEHRSPLIIVSTNDGQLHVLTDEPLAAVPSQLALAGACCSATDMVQGSMISNAAPPSVGLVSTSMVPLWAVTRLRTMASPSPVPLGLPAVVKG